MARASGLSSTSWCLQRKTQLQSSETNNVGQSKTPFQSNGYHLNWQVADHDSGVLQNMVNSTWPSPNVGAEGTSVKMRSSQIELASESQVSGWDQGNHAKTVIKLEPKTFMDTEFLQDGNAGIVVGSGSNSRGEKRKTEKIYLDSNNLKMSSDDQQHASEHEGQEHATSYMNQRLQPRERGSDKV
jgi:hypothetical protein